MFTHVVMTFSSSFSHFELWVPPELPLPPMAEPYSAGKGPLSPVSHKQNYVHLVWSCLHSLSRHKKIQKGKTDSEAISESILKSNTRPEARNLISIFSALTGKKMQDVISNWNGKAFSEFKKELGLLLVEKICPIGKEIIKLKSDPVFLKQILKDGSKKAQEVANSNLMEIKKIVGLV